MSLGADVGFPDGNAVLDDRPAFDLGHRLTRARNVHPLLVRRFAGLDQFDSYVERFSDFSGEGVTPLFGDFVPLSFVHALVVQEAVHGLADVPKIAEKVVLVAGIDRYLQRKYQRKQFAYNQLVRLSLGFLEDFFPPFAKRSFGEEAHWQGLSWDDWFTGNGGEPFPAFRQLLFLLLQG